MQKRGTRHSSQCRLFGLLLTFCCWSRCAQDEIHTLLLAFAEAGARVLRLKGGDPYVYGRGGEEVRGQGLSGQQYLSLRLGKEKYNLFEVLVIGRDADLQEPGMVHAQRVTVPCVPCTAAAPSPRPPSLAHHSSTIFVCLALNTLLLTHHTLWALHFPPPGAASAGKGNQGALRARHHRSTESYTPPACHSSAPSTCHATFVSRLVPCCSPPNRLQVQHLQAQGIKVNFVPGITAVLALHPPPHPA